MSRSSCSSGGRDVGERGNPASVRELTDRSVEITAHRRRSGDGRSTYPTSRVSTLEPALRHRDDHRRHRAVDKRRRERRATAARVSDAAIENEMQRSSLGLKRRPGSRAPRSAWIQRRLVAAAAPMLRPRDHPSYDRDPSPGHHRPGGRAHRLDGHVVVGRRCRGSVPDVSRVSSMQSEVALPDRSGPGGVSVFGVDATITARCRCRRTHHVRTRDDYGVLPATKPVLDSNPRGVKMDGTTATHMAEVKTCIDVHPRTGLQSSPKALWCMRATNSPSRLRSTGSGRPTTPEPAAARARSGAASSLDKRRNYVMPFRTASVGQTGVPGTINIFASDPPLARVSRHGSRTRTGTTAVPSWRSTIRRRDD